MVEGSLSIAFLLATLAGAAIPLGAWLATLDRLLPVWSDHELRHTVAAFGAGALVAAVGLVLVPHGTEHLTMGPALALFGAGGLVFFLLDRAIARRGGHIALFIALMVDFLPEALALGTLLRSYPHEALMLAILVAVQNLPDAFSAGRQLRRHGDMDRRWLIVLFVAVVPLGPLAAGLGWFVLADSPHILGAILMFSAGGILYLLFEDIAPQVALKRHWAPPHGAVAGFGVGLATYMALGSG